MIDVLKSFQKSQSLFLKDPRAWLVPLAGWAILFIAMLLSAKAPRWANTPLLVILAVPAVILAFGNILVGFSVIRGEMIDYHEAYTFDSRHLNFAVALLLLGIAQSVVMSGGMELLRGMKIRDRYSAMILSALICAFIGRLSLVAPLIVDQTKAVVDAFTETWEKTKGLGWQVYAYYFVVYVAFSLDAQIYHIALIFLIPIHVLMTCILYEQLWLSKDPS